MSTYLVSSKYKVEIFFTYLEQRKRKKNFINLKSINLMKKKINNKKYKIDNFLKAYISLKKIIKNKIPTPQKRKGGLVVLPFL